MLRQGRGARHLALDRAIVRFCIDDSYEGMFSHPGLENQVAKESQKGQSEAERDLRLERMATGVTDRYLSGAAVC